MDIKLRDLTKCGVRPIENDICLDYSSDTPREYKACVVFNKIVAVRDNMILENKEEILNPNSDVMYEMVVCAGEDTIPTPTRSDTSGLLVIETGNWLNTQNTSTYQFMYYSFIIYINPLEDKILYCKMPMVVSYAFWDEIKELLAENGLHLLSK